VRPVIIHYFHFCVAEWSSGSEGLKRINRAESQAAEEVCNRRIFLLAAHPGEGRFTQATADAQAWRRELVLVPQLGRSRARPARADSGPGTAVPPCELTGAGSGG